jgi:hypothetical protein
MEMVPVPPEAGNDALVTGSVTAHAPVLAPAWLTVNVCPPMSMVPLLGEALEFAAAEKTTVPLPEPDVPVVTAIQVALDCAVQAHPADAVTFVLPVPPAAATDALDAERENVQAGGGGGGGAAPDGETVMVSPATVSVPLRAEVPAFAATE